MNRWVKVGGAVLLLAWAPFLYAELTSSPQEKKDREIREAAEAAEVELHAAEPAEEAADEPGADEPESPSAATAAKIAALTAEKPEGETNPVEPESAEALAEDEADPAAAPDAPPPSKVGPVPAFKSAFENEPRDALWAKDTEARIGSILSGGDVPEGFLERASCRKSVCRVELRWTQENAAPYLDAYEELHQAFGTDIAVDPQLAAGEHAPADGIPVHVYVMRKGYTAADLNK